MSQWVREALQPDDQHLRVREALQPDDQHLREELTLPSLAPPAFPSTQNQEHSKHSKDMDAPADTVVSLI